MHTHLIAALVLSVNAGSALVQSHGCEGCHAGKLASLGADRPAVMNALLHPKAPMPNYGFSEVQASEIADYLASLGNPASQPRITISPEHLTDAATVTVFFAGKPPDAVTATATMAMGSSTMSATQVQLQRSADGHRFTGRVQFSMGGPWTLHIRYGTTQIDRPLEVGE